MGLLSKLFGFRWSLYFSNQKKEIYCAMHYDSVVGLLHQIYRYFLEYGDPPKKWRLYLNFNKTDESILLKKEFFCEDLCTDEFLKMINKIDPEFRKYPPQTYSAPEFIDLVNNKSIKILSHDESLGDPIGLVKNIMEVEKVIGQFFNKE